jgi:putative peptidoglycan lipid II flippase
MSLLKSAATVSVFTLLSRITGLVRDMLIARYFGVSAATDAFYVAFRIPNMLRRLFAEGAFSQAFVPMLSQVKEQQPEDEQKTFISDVFSLLGCAVFLASLLGIAFAPVVVWLIASGFKNTPETFDLAVFLTRCMFPYIIFMSLVSFAAAVLNTWKHFAIPAFTPVLLNVSFICCTLFHIIIIHRCKHFGERISCGCHGIFCIYLLTFDHICDRFYVIEIFQHHLMYFKNCSVDFTDFL